MEIISNPTHGEIKKAAKALKDGHLVAFPTETVYGLGADASNEKAVIRVYSVKGRPIDHPLIVHISSVKQLDKWAIDIPEYAIKLAKEFWPGPMTLILRKSSLAKDFITGGQDNIGIRIPSHSTILALLDQFERIGGEGIAAPSANRFGAVSPTTASAVEDELGNFLSIKDIILNNGQSTIGIESTIINCINSTPTILRPGAITREMITNLIQTDLSYETESHVKVPGSESTHYSPRAMVFLDKSAKAGDGFIAMANISTPKGAIRLASPSTVEDYANCLYEALRLCDHKNIKKVIVIQPTGDGIAVAIRDRLRKSASTSKAINI